MTIRNYVKMANNNVDQQLKKKSDKMHNGALRPIT